MSDLFLSLSRRLAIVCTAGSQIDQRLVSVLVQPLEGQKVPADLMDPGFETCPKDLQAAVRVWYWV
ncbi:hypothetical protein FOXG_19043 [Fusarium oxysporum f. sp. lycopersici 4287]|uniref:Uncharacterized protein n=2 Tax=Fusarium oxysporum TaxID=5507 RepID=A0A0J9UTC7_FUSO4|nr:hypothetical protein FOXG_19043 [Fusarium oxysporum f. sp. lycopersici 4287]EXK39469.1 hypothetical protein FOMG_06758 [Fusarium oxysporum f. sp. melonis 26406]KNB02520.1 hypothetical protein FOXG_19043 [Fusarium oxysporum f. sp. lycopersici 4287]